MTHAWAAFKGVAVQVAARYVPLRGRLRIMRSVVLPCLTYGCGALAVLKSELQRLDAAWVAMLCRVIRVRSSHATAEMPGAVKAIGRRRGITR